MDDEGSWRAERVLCVRCEHRWVAVYPDGAEPLECPRCGAMTGVADDDEEAH